MKAVNFEIVEIWYNSGYEPYTLKKSDKSSVKCYAIKVENNFFLLGDVNDSIFICDYKEQQ